MPIEGYRYTDEKKEHLHTLNGRPLIGTSTACGIIGKDGALAWWAAELAAVEALSTDQFYPSLREEFEAAKAVPDYKERKAAVDALQKKYPAFKAARFAHYNAKNDAADKGTDMHAELEKYVKLMVQDQGGKPHLMNGYEHKAVEAFATWAVERIEKFLLSEAHCYSERLWVGGITDCLAKMKDGRLAVIDFKSSKDAYFGQFVQAAGYALQLEEKGPVDARGKSIITSMSPLDKITALYIVPFGSSDPTPREHLDVEGRKADFEAAVHLYKSNQMFAA
jgi:hypothetical protein